VRLLRNLALKKNAKFTTLLIVLLLSASVTIGCSTVAVHPPVSLVPVRPPLNEPGMCERNETWCLWLEKLINAQVKNCTTLSVLRDEPVSQCEIK